MFLLNFILTHITENVKILAIKTIKGALRQTLSLVRLSAKITIKMAIYHLHAKTFSRARGQSAVAAAAYRSGTKLKDKRTGETFDYRRKKGVKFHNIFAPSNSPDWSFNTDALWNNAEASETRKNSTVAREIEVSIPHELSEIGQTKLIKRFSQELADKHSIAVHAAIHFPHRSNDERNVHAHLLFTTRRINEAGFHEKSREWDGSKRGSETVKYWRERWGNLANSALTLEKQTARINCKSFKARGISRLPTQHLGPRASYLEKLGYRTNIGNRNKQIKEANINTIKRTRLQKLRRRTPNSEQNMNKGYKPKR
ncbi:MAG: MobQ family relaxase [Oleiphilus sp.]